MEQFNSVYVIDIHRIKNFTLYQTGFKIFRASDTFRN